MQLPPRVARAPPVGAGQLCSSRRAGSGSPAADDKTQTVLLERLQPFSLDALLASGLDPSDCTYAELSPKGELAQLVSSFVASSPGAHSFSIDLGSKSAAGRTRAVAARRACVALGAKFILTPPCVFH